MTRAAALVGALLGIVTVIGGIREYSLDGAVPILVEGLAVGAVLVITAFLTWRRTGWAQIVMSVLGLLVLGRYLPHFFRSGRFWPDLPLLLLGSFTFGLGILGLMLDRYRPGERESHL